jgi:serpin B
MACLTACQSGGDVPSPDEAKVRQDIVLTKAELGLVAGSNTFAFDLLRNVAAKGADESHLVLSPLSAGLAFGMLGNGAAGATLSEISRTFGFADASQEAINDYYLKMLTELKAADPDVALESANSIWVNKDFQPRDAFVKVNRDKFDAEVRREDFGNPATLGLINGWCADKTHGKIYEILDKTSSDAMLYLLNALYFKGEWSRPFDKELTQNDADFANYDGTVGRVAMMHGKQLMKYGEWPGFKMAELPYGNEAFSMVVVLPDADASVASVLETLDASAWDDCLSRLSAREVALSFPRMSLEYEIELKDVLKTLGLELIFDPYQADFSGISEKQLFVSMVKQKATLDVNEEGSEAAAVTVIEVMTSSGEPSENLSLTLNRPFLFFIKEKSTGLILFEGLARKF